MNTAPNEAQLMQLYRDWWQDSYGVQPNNQAATIAAAWARHVLNVLAEQEIERQMEEDIGAICDHYMQLQAQQGGGKCVYHPAKEEPGD